MNKRAKKKGYIRPAIVRCEKLKIPPKRSFVSVRALCCGALEFV